MLVLKVYEFKIGVGVLGHDNGLAILGNEISNIDKYTNVCVYNKYQIYFIFHSMSHYLSSLVTNN